MRVGITMLSHDESWGGIGVYTREIVRNLLRIDHSNEYVLIYPAFGSSGKNLGEYSQRHANCCEVRTRQSLHWGALWEQTVVPSVAERNKIDLLFNPFWSVPIFAKYKKVMVVHGMDFHVMPETLKLRGKFEWTLHSRLWVHHADAVVSISDTMTQGLEKFDHLDPRKIRRIHHGCSGLFRPVEDPQLLGAARERYNLPQKYVLFVGMLFPQKNFANLLRAFRKLADRIPHDLVVAGRPRWNYASELSLIDTLQLTDRVRFLGHVPNEELPFIYNLADCFVFPSLYESFGMVGVEALACGCPVAAARAGAVPEVLGDAALYFDPYDVDEMARQIHTLVTDPTARAGARRRGLERAKLFTWERAATELLALFDDVKAERPAGTSNMQESVPGRLKDREGLGHNRDRTSSHQG
jgi:glycosyltransferase involved in cell wall biosynthesis